MYPRNNASPEPIAIGAVVQISDGAVQTSGVTVRIKPVGVSEADGVGTVAYSTNGIVMYTPTQAETNYTSFILIATKTGCIPVSVTVVTSQSATPGQVRLEGVNHAGATVPTVTSVTNRVTANTDQWNGTAVASATVRSDLINIGGVAVSTSTAQLGVNVVNAGGTAWGSGAITAGSIASNAITSAKIASGAITSTQLAANAIGASQIATGAITSAKFAAGAIDAAAIAADAIGASELAADAVAEIQSGLATASGVSAVEAKVDIVDAVVDSIQLDTDNIQTRIPAALVGGRMSCDVQAVNSSTSAASNMEIVYATDFAVNYNTTVDAWNVSLLYWKGDSMANAVLGSAPAHVYSIAADAVTASALASSAVTEIQSGLATASQIPAEFTSSTFASTGVFATAALANAPSGSGPSAATIADAVWDEAIAGHLTAGSTGAALNAAGGSGDPWSTVLPGSYVAGQAGWILDVIYDKALLITTQPIYSSNPVNANGEIDRDIVIGSDYLAANGQAFKWTVPIPAGYVAGTSSCKFGGRHVRGSVSSSWNLTGTVSDNGNGTADLSFDMTKIVSGELLSGLHHFSVDFINAGGTEITSVKSGKLVNVVEKQT